MKLHYLFQYFYKISVFRYSNLLPERTILALLLAFSSAISFALPSYRVLVIPTPTDLADFGEPVRDFRFIVLNDNKQVAGSYGDAYQCGHARICLFSRAFIYHPIDGMQYIGTLGGKSSAASDINESGQIIGHSGRVDEAGGRVSSHAFIWDAESGMQDITPSIIGFSAARSISNTGIVVGGVVVDNLFEWSADSGLKLVSDEQGDYLLGYLGVANNRIKLVQARNIERTSEKFFLSIPEQNDFFLGHNDPNIIGAKVTVFSMNRNGVAAGFKEPDIEPSSTFLADGNTREIITILRSSASPSLNPIDINEKLWMLGDNGNSLFIPGHEEPFHLSTLISEANGVTDLMPKKMNNHGDLVGYGIYNNKQVAVMLINDNNTAQPLQRIAQYRTDFASTPAPGWLYQWNVDVPIGQSNDYIDMQWDRWKYDSDGMPGLPDTSGLAYGHFSANGGHTGAGTSDDEKNDHYVITGYKVDEAGEYWINDSHIVHTGCEYSNGGIVNVYVNDNLINSFSFDTEGETTFDGRIGLVNTGSIIYVAVGPNGSDACDGFDWDFSIDAIILVRKGILNQPPILDNPGNQRNRVGDDIQLVLNASDPEGNILSFKATELPEGLSINSESGTISGIIAPINLFSNTHNVSVTVSDGKGGANTINFDWIINRENLVARYSVGFDDHPRDGWRYQWNPQSSIGQSNDYVDLQWASWTYDSDGVNGLPDDGGLAYGNLNLHGGHPGRGTLQGETQDRYIIAGYTVDTTEEYRIGDSLVKNNGCLFGNGGIIKVYVNDDLIDSNNLNAQGELSFDVNLGTVEAGSTIYVAFGANGEDGCDRFEWDFSIELN